MKEIIDQVKSMFRSTMKKEQEKPNQYVVQYRKVSDDSFLGYHASSMCQLTDDRESAKRYNGDNPYDQIQTIHGNLKTVLTADLPEDHIFKEIYNSMKKNYYSGLTIKDIYLEAEYLDSNTPPQTFKFTEV